MDETVRMKLVADYHRSEGIELPSVTAHATIHVIVENQIALGVDMVIDTEERLLREGLDRHEVIHAIGAILSEQIHDTLTSGTRFGDAEYKTRLETLTAKGWKKGQW